MGKTMLGMIAGLLFMCGATVAAGPFTDNGNGTVTDGGSHLVWQKEHAGATRLWESALTYCETLDLGGHADWRLPNIKELSSIVDDSRYNPAIDTTYFPGTSGYFWSSSTSANYTGSAWSVNFDTGYVYNYGKSYDGYTYYVRCVRGGQ